MLIFLDESGDSGMKAKRGSSGYFIVAVVLFEDGEEAERCESSIRALRGRLDLHERFEFHFNRCSDRLRIEFLSAVANCAFFCHAVVLNKSRLWGRRFQDKNSFYKYAAGLVFENAKKELFQAKVVIDRCGNRDFRIQLGNYLKRRMNVEADLIRKISMEASHSNDLLQLADMVCGAVARSLNVSKTEPLRISKTDSTPGVARPNMAKIKRPATLSLAGTRTIR